MPNSIKIHESVTAVRTVIDRSHAPSGLSPLSTFLTNRCRGHTQIDGPGRNNWEFKSVSGHIRPHHTQTSPDTTSHTGFLKFHSPQSQSGDLFSQGVAGLFLESVTPADYLLIPGCDKLRNLMTMSGLIPGPPDAPTPRRGFIQSCSLFCQTENIST